ncbi:helix-turn-helix transcriptional regulator [Microbacterium sp.]|uniref:helix-turn-helix transcriptional regulator n=1 Tax=Microbacterium sp. TaxID=51671 RepID=UPI003A8DA2A8
MPAQTSPALSRRRVFLGRDRELAEFAATVQAGLSSGVFLVVEGEGGIGKTSLIDAALARPAQTHQVLRGAADAMDRRRAHGILLDALAPVLTADDRRVCAEQNEHIAGERLLSVIDAATSGPTVLVLEDLHWADPASLRLLARLARTLSQLPLVVVASVRTQAREDTAPELDQLLTELGHRDLLHSLRLSPLSAAACIRITEQITRSPVGKTLADYTAVAGGNPLFLTEMVHTLLRDGAVTVGPKGADLRDVPVGPSPSLVIVIMRHLSQISAAARALLRNAALLGTRFPAAQLRMISGQQMSELLPALRETFAAGLLVEIDDDTLGFHHELVQAVLLHDVPTPVRAELHREIARRLDEGEVSATTVAGHLLRAPMMREDIPWMMTLAQNTAASAPDTAIELWERVAAHTEVSDPMHVQAVAGLARLALNAGRAAEAGRLVSTVLAHAEGTGAGPMLRNIDVRSLVLQHRHDEARERAHQYAASETLDAGERAAHLAFAGWPSLLLGRTEEARRLTIDGAAFAAANGNPVAEANALTLQGLIANGHGDLDDAVTLLTRAVDLAERTPSLAAVEAFQHASLAVALADLDRVDESGAMLRRSLQLSEQYGFRTGILATHTLAAQARSRSGTLPDISTELEAHAALLGTMDISLDPPVRGLRAYVVAMQEGPAAAREAAEQVDPASARKRWTCRGSSWIWLGHSQLARADGDPAAVLDVLWRGWDDLRAADLFMDCAELALDLIEVWQRVGIGSATGVDASRPDAPVRTDADRASAEVTAVVAAVAAKNPTVAHLRATSLGVTGVVTGDADALVEAEHLMAGTPRTLDHARFAKLAALALPAKDARTRALAETALRAYAEVGAEHEIARARASFRRLGIALHTPRRARPRSGWDALTRTEEKIAAHIADGQTNPEIAQSLFISRRTVETHVSHVLTKLGLRSRTELAIRFAQRSGE